MSANNEANVESQSPAPEAPTVATPGAAATEPVAPADAAAQAAAAVQDQLDTLRKERDDNYNHYVRAMADLENYRRRVAREKEELRQFGNRDLIEAIIPVFEGLGLAIKSAETAADAAVIARGVNLVLEQFRGVLSSKGLTEINPTPGSDFDPNQHESIAHGPSETVPEEKVLQVVRAGFSLNGRLIRPASVVLSGGPASA